MSAKIQPEVVHDFNKRPAIIFKLGHSIAHMVGRKENETIGVIEVPKDDLNFGWKKTMLHDAPYPVAKAAQFWLDVNAKRVADGCSPCCTPRAERILVDLLANKDNIDIGTNAEDAGVKVAAANVDLVHKPRILVRKPVTTEASPAAQKRSLIRPKQTPPAKHAAADDSITAGTLVQFIKDPPADSRDTVKAVAAALKAHKKAITIRDLRELIGKPCKDNVIKLVAWGCAAVTK